VPTYLPTCVLIYTCACPPPYFLTPWREPPNSPPSASASASASAPATRLQSSPAPSSKRGGGKTDRGTAEHKPPRRRQLEPVVRSPPCWPGRKHGAMCSSPTPLSYDNKHTNGWGHLHWVSMLDTNGAPAVTRDGLACLLADPLVPTGHARARRLGWWRRVRRLSEPAAATSCHRVWVHDGWVCHGVAR
jgi:hypothetical protein